MAGSPRAILFDIDGTLLVTGGAGGVAWQRGFEELYGIEANAAEHTDAGMTDPEIVKIIFSEVIGREGSAEERAKAIGCYLKHLPDAVAESDGYRVMPGIEELLDRLIDGGTLLGLVTGNVEAAAHIKLARAGLNRFFSFGGYGSDSPDRTEVTRASFNRAKLISGNSLHTSSCISVGDTPRDVSAGHGAGIKVVGVATGSYTIDQLDQAGADWSLESVEAGFPA
ncbi:MAG TPA: HAD family hydrolase [Solirubrobacterales bacterium]|nr:HAD family hydrolase [Solirubrobacterales bacterium]